ncbi:MAG: hypothetical protein GY778_27970, partial [bacterium]|nr:hypothetical protein [bacterium]
PTDGAFYLIDEIGLADNPALGGGRNVSDVDGLEVDPLTGDLWAMHQEPGATGNLVFRIDPTSGHIVEDTFGPGADYAAVNLAADQLVGCTDPALTCNPGDDCPDVLDDLAVHPDTGEFFAVANIDENPRVDWLVRIMLDGGDPANSPGYDAATGLLELCLVGAISDGQAAVTDVEGLTFAANRTLYGTTGSSSVVQPNRNTLWTIDPASGLVERVGLFADNRDFEGVACVAD